VAFAGPATLRVSGGNVRQEGGLTGAVSQIPANGRQTFKVAGARTDCVAKQTYVAVLLDRATGRPLAAWDSEAVEMTTAPPTDCRATTSQRQYRWDPRM
jgi:hypothetical protein